MLLNYKKLKNKNQFNFIIILTFQPEKRMGKTKAKAKATTGTKIKIKAKAEPETYIVEKVLEAVKWGKTKWYLVKWMNYPEDENSWVKHQDIHRDLVNTPNVLAMFKSTKTKSKTKAKKGQLSLKIEGDEELIINIAKILAGMKYE